MDAGLKAGSAAGKAALSGYGGESLGWDLPLDVLLAVTGALQLGALATRVIGRRRAALLMAGANAVLGFALSLMVLAGAVGSHERMELTLIVLVALQVAAAVASTVGWIKRREPGWVFWPVWLWNFAMIYALVRLRFFFRLYF